MPQSSIVKQPAALEEGNRHGADGSILTFLRSKEPEESATSVPDSLAAGLAACRVPSKATS